MKTTLLITVGLIACTTVFGQAPVKTTSIKKDKKVAKMALELGLSVEQEVSIQEAMNVKRKKIKEAKKEYKKALQEILTEEQYQRMEKLHNEKKKHQYVKE